MLALTVELYLLARDPQCGMRFAILWDEAELGANGQVTVVSMFVRPFRGLLGAIAYSYWCRYFFGYLFHTGCVSPSYARSV